VQDAKRVNKHNLRKKPSTWKTNVAHPRWHLSDQAAKCLHRMKALYEVLVD
ncbi:hypothetical protein KUCAC02_012875, partial [Chaenocephalus aceratus]